MTELTVEQFEVKWDVVESSEDGQVIGPLCLCGNKSKNGYTYTRESFGDGSVYNGVPVFIDHFNLNPLNRDAKNRSIRDLAGTIESVSITNGKPYGKVRTNSTEAGNTLREFAKSRIPNVGLSHAAKCKHTYRSGGITVEQVEHVASVDIVCFPATTTSLFEQTEGQDMDNKTVEVLERQSASMQSERDAAVKELSEVKSAHETFAKDALEKVSGLEESNKTLESEVDTFRTEKALTERRAAIGAELKEAELNTEDKALVSDTFVEHLMSEPDSVKRKTLIADRKAVRESAGRTEQVISQERTSAHASSFDTEKAFSDVFK